MMYWGDWGHGLTWGGMVVGSILMLLFWAIVIAIIVLAFRALTRSGGGSSSGAGQPMTRPEDNALTILRERYARGEIDKETYDRMRSDLLT